MWCEKNCETIKEEVKKVFGKAEIIVKEDLMAAAYAAYSGKPAIVCILGTGSNSCYFDGENLKIELPSLDSLLGTREAEVPSENNWYADIL